MAFKFLGKAVDWVWAFIALALVLLAIYVGLGRQLITQVGDYREDIEQAIAERTGFRVTIGSIEGQWPLFTPVFQLSDVALYLPGYPDKAFFLSDRLTVDVSLVASFMARQPRLRDLQIEGLHVSLVQKEEEGLWYVNGVAIDKKIAKGTASDGGENAAEGPGSIISLLLNQELITLSDCNLTLEVPGRPARAIRHINAQLKNYSDIHEFSGSILMGEEGQRFIFAARGIGDPRDQEDYELELYGKLDQGAILHWLPEDVKQKYSAVFGVTLQELSIAGEVWAHWHEGGFHDINGLVEADSIQLAGNKGQAVPPIENLVGQFEVAFGAEGELSVAFDHFQFDWQGEFWRESQVKVTLFDEGEMRPPSLEVFSNHVQVRQVLQLLSLSEGVDEKLGALLTGTQINGELLDLNLRYYPRRKSFQLRSRFEDLSSKSWNALPGGSGLSGYIEMTPNRGALWLDSKGAAMDFPRYFRQPIYTRKLTGAAVWVLHQGDSGIEEIEVQSGFFEVENPDVQGNVAFSLNVPTDGFAPRLKLFANIKQADVHKVPRYLPKVLPTSLLHWLDDSLVKGESEATLVYNGPLRLKGLDETDFTLQTDITAQHLSLDYLPKEWPPIEDGRGKLLLNGADVFFELDKGRIYGSQIRTATGTVLENEQGYRDLDLQGEVDADASDVIRFLNETPISGMIGGLTETWQAEGDTQGALQLTVPIHGPSRPMEVRYEANLSATRLDLTEQELAMEDINGRVVYDSAFGLYGQDLDCKVFDSPAKASFKKLDQSQPRLFQMALNSQVSVEKLNQWADQGILQFMTGTLDYHLDLWVEQNQRVGNSETEAWVSVRSDLVGVEVNIPEPLKKASQQPRPMEFKMALGEFPAQMFLQYGDAFSAALLVDAQDLLRAQYSFSKKPAVIPSTDGLFADGEMQFLDWDLWERFFTDLGNAYETGSVQVVDDTAVNTAGMAEMSEGKQATKNASKPGAVDEDAALFVDKVKSVDLAVAQFTGYGMDIDALNAHVWREDSSWMVYGKSPTVTGRLKVPDDARPLEVNLTQLTIPEEDEKPEEPEKSNESKDGTKDSTNKGNETLQTDTTEEEVISDSPMEFPNAIVKIDRYVYGDMDLGSWSLSAYRNQGSYFIEDLRVKLGQLVLTGNGEWKPQGDSSVTQFNGAINTQDIGELMDIWGYPVTIETNSAGITFQGHWPHSPLDFYLNRLEGDFNLRFKEGRFLDVDATVSALRLLGVLNFANLGRRLRLDFKDLYQGGLSFDRVKGPVHVTRGVIHLNELEINGPSANFEVNGLTDLNEDTLALDIALTLPLSKNLAPVAGVVAGPLGVVAGVVIDRVIGDQINQMFRTHYEVSGPLSDPQFRIVPRVIGNGE